MLVCWCGILTGVLHVLQLQLLPPLPSPLVPKDPEWRNGDILVPANPGPPGKWPLKRRVRCKQPLRSHQFTKIRTFQNCCSSSSRVWNALPVCHPINNIKASKGKNPTIMRKKRKFKKQRSTSIKYTLRDSRRIFSTISQHSMSGVNLPRMISGTIPVCIQAAPLASTIAAANLLSDTPSSIFSFLEDFGRLVSRNVWRSGWHTPEDSNHQLVMTGRTGIRKEQMNTVCPDVHPHRN